MEKEEYKTLDDQCNNMLFQVLKEEEEENINKLSVRILMTPSYLKFYSLLFNLHFRNNDFGEDMKLLFPFTKLKTYYRHVHRLVTELTNQNLAVFLKKRKNSPPTSKALFGLRDARVHLKIWKNLCEHKRLNKIQR